MNEQQRFDKFIKLYNIDGIRLYGIYPCSKKGRETMFFPGMVQCNDYQQLRIGNLSSIELDYINKNINRSVNRKIIKIHSYTNTMHIREVEVILEGGLCYAFLNGGLGNVEKLLKDCIAWQLFNKYPNIIDNPSEEVLMLSNPSEVSKNPKERLCIAEITIIFIIFILVATLATSIALRNNQLISLYENQINTTISKT